METEPPDPVMLFSSPPASSPGGDSQPAPTRLPDPWGGLPGETGKEIAGTLKHFMKQSRSSVLFVVFNRNYSDIVLLHFFRRKLAFTF